MQPWQRACVKCGRTAVGVGGAGPVCKRCIGIDERAHVWYVRRHAGHEDLDWPMVNYDLAYSRVRFAEHNYSHSVELGRVFSPTTPKSQIDEASMGRLCTAVEEWIAARSILVSLCAEIGLSWNELLRAERGLPYSEFCFRDYIRAKSKDDIRRAYKRRLKHGFEPVDEWLAISGSQD